MTFASFVLAISLLCVASSLVWIVLLAAALANRRKWIQLSELPSREPAAGWPRLAVVIAARDEEAMIANSVRSIVDQDYPDLELIVVDDRSADRTGAILDGLAKEEPRLSVVHVDALPDGWLGKTHAMQRGADETFARWILFTDGDVILAPGALRRAVAYAVDEGADHLVALPDAIAVGFGERMFLALFALMFSIKFPSWRVDDRNSRVYVGVGAFNLVRAEAFRGIGGLRRVALSIDDDMRLGQALKYAGYRTKAFSAASQVSVRWQVGIGGMVRGVEKNFFAGIDFRLPMAFAAAATILFTTLGPLAGLFIGPWWTRLICGLGLLAPVALIRFVSPSTAVAPWYGLTLPLAGPVMTYALARSVVLTLRRRGVSWRGRTYPLAELRSHVRLRNHWLNEVWHSTR
jgi:cellulose synthase/poly-beta-1,6-N-acetylglucosamine synthase-like glycosyltransferase